jgi:NADH dehydrogenase
VAYRPQVVSVGGGFGGLSAARSLRGVPVDVTLIDKENYHQKLRGFSHPLQR